MAKLFICGDIVNYTNSCSFIGSGLINTIRSADYAICNLEGAELQKGNNTTFPCQNTGTIHFLKSVGFQLLLLANNHITDAGKDALSYTLSLIDGLGLHRVGAGMSWQEAYNPVEVVIESVSFAFFNICEAQVGQYVSEKQEFGYAWIGNRDIVSAISEKKKQVDHVVVFVHAGLEHYETPLPYIRSYYKELCDAGASCIVGGHPHCAQGYEYYNNKLIVYSLGNFFFPPSVRWPQEVFSYSALLDIEKRGAIRIQPVFHFNNGDRVEITTASKVNLEGLNNKLGEKYTEESKRMINHAYHNLCERLLLEATCGQSSKDNLKTVIQKAIKYTFQRNKYIHNTNERRRALIKRLFENETYRSVIINALNHDDDKN